MRRHIERLREAFPSVLFAGEGMHEHLAGLLPLSQIHGLDSTLESQGRTPQWREIHPVSCRLFGPYTRFTAHLLTKHPSHPLFSRQERAYAALGVIPALCLYDVAQPLDTPEVRAMIARTERLGT